MGSHTPNSSIFYYFLYWIPIQKNFAGKTDARLSETISPGGNKNNREPLDMSVLPTLPSILSISSADTPQSTSFLS
jgi:hypothetical protein